MDIDVIKKLSQDKIEADFLTRIVRRNIKRKEREKQDAREAFRQAFEVLIESQDKSAASQNAMFDELKAIKERLNPEAQQQPRRQLPPYQEESPSDKDEFVDAREEQPRHRRYGVRRGDINNLREQQEDLRQQQEMQQMQQQLMQQQQQMLEQNQQIRERRIEINRRWREQQ